MTYGNIARCYIGNHRRDEQGRDATCTLLVVLECLTHEGADTSDTRAYVYPETVGIDVLATHQSAILHGLVGCSNSILAIEVHLTYIGTLKAMSGRVKVLHLCHDAHGEVYVIKSLDEVQSTLTVLQAFPEIRHCISYGADGAQSGNHNSSFHICLNFHVLKLSFRLKVLKTYQLTKSKYASFI